MAAGVASAAGPGGIERHTIFPIPLDQRHGTGAQLLTLWFGANMTVLTIVTGALATTTFGQSFAGAVLAILLGNIVGAVFMALHAAQGPALGVPQMVQSRGQFGSVGAAFVVLIVIVMYVGYFASSNLIGGQSLHAIIPWVGVREGTILVGFASLAATVYGHDLIHLFTRLMTYFSGVALAVAFTWIVAVVGLPAGFLAMGRDSAVGFFGTLSIAALWQISYAPYVSDYSRYLPPDTGPRAAFWASYLGCVAGAVIPMILGAMLGVVTGADDVVTTMARMTGPARYLIVPLFALGIAAGSALNLYCGALSTITLGQTFVPNWRASSRARIVIAVAMLLGSLWLSLLAADNFLDTYTKFIELLLYVMVPWTAVNLVDYYLVRHGDYDVAAFFTSDGGIYGKYNWPALACYGVGIVVQIPFIATDLYTGPLAAALGGIDVSWVVGLVVVSPLYYWVMTRFAAGSDAVLAATGDHA